MALSRDLPIAETDLSQFDFAREAVDDALRRGAIDQPIKSLSLLSLQVEAREGLLEQTLLLLNQGALVDQVLEETKSNNLHVQQQAKQTPKEIALSRGHGAIADVLRLVDGSPLSEINFSLLEIISSSWIPRKNAVILSSRLFSLMLKMRSLSSSEEKKEEPAAGSNFWKSSCIDPKKRYILSKNIFDNNYFYLSDREKSFVKLWEKKEITDAIHRVWNDTHASPPNAYQWRDFKKEFFKNESEEKNVRQTK
jgi:hypothetical protein